MRQKTKVQIWLKPSNWLHSALILSIIGFLVNGCFLKQDRTTMIYGTITDQKGQPVDSITVMLSGFQGFKYEILKQVYSDDSGRYELVVEVPSKFGSADVSVPFGSKLNPKYQKYYKGKTSHKNDEFTNNCCSASIGQKTKYDFQLIPR